MTLTEGGCVPNDLLYYRYALLMFLLICLLVLSAVHDTSLYAIYLPCLRHFRLFRWLFDRAFFAPKAHLFQFFMNCHFTQSCTVPNGTKIIVLVELKKKKEKGKLKEEWMKIRVPSCLVGWVHDASQSNNTAHLLMRHVGQMGGGSSRHINSTS